MENLIKAGFVKNSEVGNEQIFILKTPCRFVVKQNMVLDLKNNYLPNEEIGGLMWALPKKVDNEYFYEIEKISYLRNIIEDKQRDDGLNKSNAYLHDRDELNKEIAAIFTAGYLPIKFHTHPTERNNSLGSLFEQLHQAETSQQDRRESKIPFSYNGDKILTPRALVIGNEFKSGDIIIALYDGGIAPAEVKDSIEKVQKKNMELFSDKLGDVQFTEREKLILFVAAMILLIVIIKYPKAGWMLLLGTGATAPLLLSKTNHLEGVECYSKLNDGEAKIFVP